MSGSVSAQTTPHSALEREYLGLQDRLMSLQQHVLATRPQLLVMIGDMEDLISDRMREKGFDPGSLMETLLVAQEQLQDPGLTDADRMRILQDPAVLEAQSKLEAAQMAVMDDPDIINAQQQLQRAVLQAAREEEPDFDRMLERLEQMQREIFQPSR